LAKVTGGLEPPEMFPVAFGDLRLKNPPENAKKKKLSFAAAFGRRSAIFDVFGHLLAATNDINSCSDLILNYLEECMT
jgi:hypothetical protein